MVLDRIADEGGVAIAVVDRSSVELSVSNNNSICRKLNPGGEFSRGCAAYCGTALEESTEVGGPVNFTCHAGLDCRSAAMTLDGKPVAVIVGRSFGKAENYRLATERAISGDWRSIAPSALFENILLTSSSDLLEKSLEQVQAAATVFETGTVDEPVDDQAGASGVTRPDKMADEIKRLADQINSRAANVVTAPAEPAPRPANAAAWRSFFGSLLSKDHAQACGSILEFLSGHYGFGSLAWLERRDHRFVAVAGHGSLKGRKLKLGIPTDDARLSDAVRDEMPVELSERARDAAHARTMFLFPVPVGGEIPSALAVLDDIPAADIRRQVARLCHSLAPQLEILRLRGEVVRRETVSQAVRKFSRGLKHVDSDDFWLHLTQVAAELMQAERGSLLVVDEATGDLVIKAMVGARGDISTDAEPGSRVARIIVERGKPALVADVEKAGLSPAAAERGYKTRSFLSTPLSIGNRHIAVINFTDKATGGEFDRDDLELLQEITPQIAVAVDRAILKEKAGQFQQLSVTDALTGLLNRRYIEERLIEEVKRSNRHGYPMSFILLDVDHFKSYNDQFGHPAGDEALKLVGQVLRETLRGADVAARYGGEEFAILLPQTTNDEAATIAERLRANVEATTFPCRPVTISIGVASCSNELCTTDGIVLAADKALYAAKHSGRNTVQIYDEIDAG